MEALLQRLRELSAAEFENLCFQLIQARHPGMNIHKVEGSGGDEGIDLFVGEMGGDITIWQCKAFRNGIGKSQKQQIRNSLNAAVKNHAPKTWILCPSCVMNVKSHRWFQKLQKSNESRVKVGLFSAERVAGELLHRRTLRAAFFPQLEIDVVELKRLVMSTGDMGDSDFEKFADATVEDLVERLKAQDARFNYEIVASSELGPAPPPARPGIIASMRRGNKWVNMYARDFDALRRDPPRLTVQFSDEGAQKLMTAVRKGVSQRFGAGEFRLVESTFPLLERAALDPAEPGATFTIRPSVLPTERRIPVRVVFSGRDGSEEYAFVEFVTTRLGTEEAEMMSISAHIPFVLTLTAEQRGLSGKIDLDLRLAGASVQKLRKLSRVLSLMESEGEISLIELREQRELARADIVLISGQETRSDVNGLITTLESIERTFGVNLIWPEVLSDEDMESYMILRAYVDGSTVQVDAISARLVKSEENSEGVPAAIEAGRGGFCLQSSEHVPPLRLFGIEIPVGPCEMSFESCRWDRPEETIEAFREAAVGDAVQIVMIPESPAHFRLPGRG